MLVRDLMSQSPVTVPSIMLLPDVANLMKSRGIRHLPVVDEHVLVGMITDRDVREALPNQVSHLSAWQVTTRVASLKVQDVMRRNLITISEDTDARHAAYVLLQNKIEALLVVNQVGRLIGIVTIFDLLKDYALVPE